VIPLIAHADSIGLRLNLLFSNICFFMLMPYISMSLFAADKQFYVADISARWAPAPAPGGMKGAGLHLLQLP
jgi:hypothetical protein